MQPGENIMEWSVTASTNGSADSLINFAEGQSRASVNNSARSMMAAIAKDRNLRNGSIVTAGTANAQTFVSDVPYTVVPTGLRVLLKIGPALGNTGAATLNMNSIGAVAIKTQTGAELSEGALIADAFSEFIYNGTNWILLHYSVPSITIVNNTTVIAATPAPVVDFTTAIDDTFDEYLFVGLNLIPAVDNDSIWCRLSIDGGATFKSGASDYSWSNFAIVDSPGTAVIGAPLDSKIVIVNGVSNNGTTGLNFSIRMRTPSSSVMQKVLDVDATHTAVAPFQLVRWSGAGRFNSTTPINGVRFMASSGNISSGIVKMYGLK